MSPEQARGESVDHRSDIFSFGVVLYEMLTGGLPFRGKSGTDTLSAILRDPTPRLSGIENAEELQPVVNRCLAKDPEERYQTTKDLLADIRRVKRDTESGARAATTPSRRGTQWVIAAALAVSTGAALLLLRSTSRFVPRVGRTIQVTRDPGLEIDASISPDGKLVAYAAGPQHEARIYVRLIAGGRPVALSGSLSGSHRFPRWSPDGASISFLREVPNDWETYIVPALGGVPRRFPVPRAFELVWSPDGEHVAYLTDNGFFIGPAKGGEARRVGDWPRASCLIWSPDGSRVAFTSGNPDYLYNLNVAPSSIWVVDVRGGEPERITDETHINISPVWTIDGKSLLFVSDRGGGRDVYRITIDRDGEPFSEPERVTTGLNVFTIASSANGRMLSYSVATLRQNLWTLPAPAEGPVSVKGSRPVTTGNQVIEGVGISADGKWLAFDSDQSGDRDLFKVQVEGGEPVRITSDPAMDCCPSWSPDGREIAFHAVRTGSRDVFVVSSDGGAARQLTSDPAQEYYPHWSADGTKIVFHSNRSGVPELYVVSNDRGELFGEAPERLTFDGGFHPRWSPDGRLIAYVRSAFGVSVVSSGGGPSRALTDFGSAPMWSKDSQTIFFIQSPPGERGGIWSVSVLGDEPKQLVRFDDPTRPPARPEWTSDGQNFSFTLAEFESDVWVMELDNEGRQ
jgi:Tol biopolymer transport system component